jgi:type IV fimbrial biogenesis protein FimT
MICPMNRARNAGFTLTELLVTLGIAAILAGLAAPNLRDFIRNSRLSDGVNDLLHSLQLARTEAIKRQVLVGNVVVGNVVVCGTTNPLPDNAQCTYNTFNGWIVFADTNGNWQHDAGEPLLERHATLDSSVSVVTDANANIVSFAPTGFANPTDPIALRVPTATVVLCDERGVTAVGTNSTARALFINQTGRAFATAAYLAVRFNALPLVRGGTCP